MTFAFTADREAFCTTATLLGTADTRVCWTTAGLTAFRAAVRIFATARNFRAAESSFRTTPSCAARFFILATYSFMAAVFATQFDNSLSRGHCREKHSEDKK